MGSIINTEIGLNINVVVMMGGGRGVRVEKIRRLLDKMEKMEDGRWLVIACIWASNYHPLLMQGCQTLA